MPTDESRDGALEQLFVGDLLSLLARTRRYDEEQLATALGLAPGTVRVLSGQLVSTAEARAFCVTMELDFQELLNAVTW